MLLLALVASSACSKKRGDLAFPTDTVASARADVLQRAERVGASISRIEADIALVTEPVADGWFSTEDLHFVRFTLVECFVSPICMNDDARAVCVELARAELPPEDAPLGLGMRISVPGFRPCPLRDIAGLRDAESRWSNEQKEWFALRMEAVDLLRVRLKALIPDRSTELDRVLDALDLEIRQHYMEAEDRWRYAQRQEVRSETRRREEEQWDRFQGEMNAYEEEMTKARDRMEALRALSRREVLRIVMRLATLGEPLF